jgi:DNA-binding GntR family transcriptional regulator
MSDVAAPAEHVPRRRRRSLEDDSWPRRAAEPERAEAAEDRALRNLVRDHVLDALRAGHLPGGTRVHETELARTLGVSLAPVREALFRLVDQGVIEHRPRRGFFVTVLGEAEIQEIYTVRALLEGFAARLIAERFAAGEGASERLQEGRRALEELIAAGEAAGRVGDRLGVRDVNARFHDEIFILTRHVLLRRLWVSLAPTTWLLTPGARLAPIGRAEAQEWAARHRRLLSAITSGDADAAEGEAAAHVRDAGAERLDRARERNARAASEARAASQEEADPAGRSPS